MIERRPTGGEKSTIGGTGVKRERAESSGGKRVGIGGADDVEDRKLSSDRESITRHGTDLD